MLVIPIKFECLYWIGQLRMSSGSASQKKKKKGQKHVYKTNKQIIRSFFFCFCFFFSFNRHLLQYDPAPENSVLHSQLDHPLRRHFVSVRVSVLPSGRFGRKGGAVHQHPFVADHVLLAHFGDYPVHVTSRPPAGQIPPFHHVPRRPVRPHHHRHSQHALPQTIHAQDGAMGTAHFYPSAAKDPSHAGTQTSQRGSRGTNEGLFFFFYS